MATVWTEIVPSDQYQKPSAMTTQPSSSVEPPVYPMPSERSAKSAMVVPKVVEATATVTGWLAEHPSITVIARDRGAGYKQAADDGCPEAVQVADRWHLMENASAAFLNAVRRSMHTIRKAVGTGNVDPASLSAAERRQHAGYLLRERKMLKFWRWRPKVSPSRRS